LTGSDIPRYSAYITLKKGSKMGRQIDKFDPLNIVTKMENFAEMQRHEFE